MLYSKKQREWPGTISIPTAIVYYFKITNRTKNILFGATDSLFNWRSPQLPDDLCFLKGNKEWLVTTSHEGISYMNLDSDSEFETIKSINGLVNKVISNT